MRAVVCSMLALGAQPALAQPGSVPCAAMGMLVKQGPIGFLGLAGEADRGGTTAKTLKGYDWCRITPAPAGGQSYYCSKEGMDLGEATKLQAQVETDLRECFPEWESTNAGLGLPITPVKPIAEGGVWSGVSGGRMVFGVVHLLDESKASSSIVSFAAAYIPDSKPQ